MWVSVTVNGENWVEYADNVIFKTGGIELYENGRFTFFFAFSEVNNIYPDNRTFSPNYIPRSRL